MQDPIVVNEDDALVVNDVRKTYKTKNGVVQALRGVSFSVKRGEVFGLLGPNGAGKTTLINTLTGLIEPDEGTILFFGEIRSEKTQSRMNASTAYNALNRNLTVYQNLYVYAKIYDVKNPKEKIESLLKQFHIEDLRKRRIYELSSGQKTRVNLCKGLINSPDLLFLDEATAGLDPDIASDVRNVIRNLNTTIIFTSHMMTEVEELCDRVAFLRDGKILEIDEPENFKKLIETNDVTFEFLKEPKLPERVLKKIKAKRVSKNAIIVSLKKKTDLHDTIQTLVDEGFIIHDMHFNKPTLDDVFIKISRREI